MLSLRCARPESALLVGWTALSAGACLARGTFTPAALALVTAGVAALVLAGQRLRRGAAAGSATAPPAAGLPAALALTTGAALVGALLLPAGAYAAGPGAVSARVLLILAVVAAAVAGTARRAGPLPGLVVLGLATAACLQVVRAAPSPRIDVWYVREGSVRALLDGRNPYASCWPGNPDPVTDCVYPYLPGKILVDVLPVVLGDVRLVSVLALGAAAVVVHRIAPGPVAVPLAALVVVAPGTTFLVEQAWTEPLLLAALALMVLAVREGRTAWAVVAFAAALATKQHMLLLVPLAAWWPAFGLRRALWAVGVAVAVTLPFVAVDPRAFVADALTLNLTLAPRLDSLSAFTPMTTAGREPHFALVGALTLLAIAGTRLLPRDAAGFVSGAAVVLGVFNLLNKQTFFNHWWLVGGLAVVATAVSMAGPGRARPVEERSAQGESTGSGLLAGRTGS